MLAYRRWPPRRAATIRSALDRVSAMSRAARSSRRLATIQPRRLPSAAVRAGRRFARLVAVMAHLRSPRGCPWDRRQTLASLKSFLLEETYEALDAIDRRDFDGLREELGDLLFEAVFLAQLNAEAGRFDVADALETIVDKLLRRHPHVFGPKGRVRPTTARAVVEQWERLKAREQGGRRRRSVLDGLPRSLPALLGAYKIGARAAAVGFDWRRAADVLDKVEEEIAELRRAIRRGRRRTIGEELGDLLFAVANLARKLEIEPEGALRRANDKFARRFAALERGFRTRGRTLHEATLAELDAEWTRIKARARARRRA
jgi:MazG family protein